MSYVKPDFPFTIVDVIQSLGLEIRSIHNNEMYIDCPNHGDRGKGKCQVLISEGVYNCPHCGQFDGGILDLYCYYRNVDRKQANKEMREYVSQTSYKAKKIQIHKIVSSAEKSIYNNTKIASRPDIDKTYRTLLSLCGLSDRHKNDLISRGLSIKNINHFGFKSVPCTENEIRPIIDKLISYGCRLDGVPGFYIDKRGKWNMNLYSKCSGFFVPMCNLQNECLGLQIRVDEPVDGRKYIWLSSKNKNHGVGRTSVPHISNVFHSGETIYLTEGALKADVAHCLCNRTFIAVAGVTQYKVFPLLFSQLKKNGIKRIIDTFDADCKYNKNVEYARQRLKQYVLKAGLDYYRMEWDEKYKGIDDYLLHHPKGHRKFIIYDK